MKDFILVYHNDADGIMSAAIADSALRDNYGNDINTFKKPYRYEKYTSLKDFLKGVYYVDREDYFDLIEQVVILDCALPVEYVKELLANDIKITWIDHHKTNIEMYSKEPEIMNNPNIYKYTSTEHSAAALTSTYYWFCNVSDYGEKIINLINIGDTYKSDDPDFPLARVMYNVFELDCSINKFKEFLLYNEEQFNTLYNIANDIETAKKMANSKVAKRAFYMEWEGYKWITCNTIGSIEQVEDVQDVIEHDGVLFFCFIPNLGWKISMYAGNNNKVDFTPIAKKYGGGGHPGACGFETKELPFTLC